MIEVTRAELSLIAVQLCYFPTDRALLARELMLRAELSRLESATAPVSHPKAS